jgi:hypothetical protein
MKKMLEFLAIASEFDIEKKDYGYEISFKNNDSIFKSIIARYDIHSKKIQYLMTNLGDNFFANEVIDCDQLDKLREFCNMLKEEKEKNERS